MSSKIINKDKLEKALKLLSEVKIDNGFGELSDVKYINIENLTEKQAAKKSVTKGITISQKSYPTMDLYTLKITNVFTEEK